jgi:hypothetical protein
LDYWHYNQTRGRNILGIDYGKSREVIKMENQTRVFSFIELTIVKFCGWIIEIDKKDLYWMIVNKNTRITSQKTERISIIARSKANYYQGRNIIEIRIQPPINNVFI